MGGSDRDLGSAGIPLASGKGRDMMDRPVPASFPHNGDEVLFASTGQLREKESLVWRSPIH